MGLNFCNKACNLRQTHLAQLLFVTHVFVCCIRQTVVCAPFQKKFFSIGFQRQMENYEYIGHLILGLHRLSRDGNWTPSCKLIDLWNSNDMKQCANLFEIVDLHKSTIHTDGIPGKTLKVWLDCEQFETYCGQCHDVISLNVHSNVKLGRSKAIWKVHFQEACVFSCKFQYLNCAKCNVPT